MSAPSKNWSFLVCFPIWFSAGVSVSENHTDAPYDLRVGIDHFRRAVPIEPEKWVTSFDMPESILRRFETGEVSITFDIAENGRAVKCRVTSQSGISRFDKVPCNLVMRRARFKAEADTKVIQPDARGQMRFRFNEAD